MATTKKILEQLRNDKSDFEWYPTSKNMIQAIKDDLLNSFELSSDLSLLEIGFGDARVIREFKKMNIILKGREEKLFSKFKGIEKSNIHISNKPDDIIFCGADFLETNISVIKNDVIFCNPPYSEYENWAEKIINESFTNVLYLILPKRWYKSKKIESVITEREYTATVIYEGDFLDADRVARAEINIIRIVSKNCVISDDNYIFTRMTKEEKNKLKKSSFIFGKYNMRDPFDLWFSKNFNNLCNKNIEKYNSYKEKKNKINEVFEKNNHIDNLVDFYNKDLNILLTNFSSLNELDSDLLSSINVDISQLKDILKEKIQQLKRSYWLNFLKNYEVIKKRMTTKFINKLQEKVISNVYDLDFNRANAFAITQIVIKESNKMSGKMVEWFFDELSKSENIINYKSNQKVFKKGDWKYLKDDFSHYKLDYRIIQSSFFSIKKFGHIDKNKVSSAIQDILVIANILGVSGTFGINVNNYLNDDNLNYGQKIIIKDDKDNLIFDIIFFKNGNQHLRLSKEFCLKLNVMIGKLRGWLTDANNAINEMDIKEEKEIQEYMNNIYDRLIIVNKEIITKKLSFIL